MENKFKEFWIDTRPVGDDSEVVEEQPSKSMLPCYIHVIDYAALQACEARLLAYETQLAESRVSLESANAEIKTLSQELDMRVISENALLQKINSLTIQIARLQGIKHDT